MTRRERLLLHLPGVLVLLVVTAGVVAVSENYWRKGLGVVGAGLVLGALARLVLPARRAGLLVVRSRITDVLVLGGLGGVIAVLAVVIPPVLP